MPNKSVQTKRYLIQFTKKPINLACIHFFVFHFSSSAFVRRTVCLNQTKLLYKLFGNILMCYKINARKILDLLVHKHKEKMLNAMSMHCFSFINNFISLKCAKKNKFSSQQLSTIQNIQQFIPRIRNFLFVLFKLGKKRHNLKFRNE